jgi:hypothetical protein
MIISRHSSRSPANSLPGHFGSCRSGPDGTAPSWKPTRMPHAHVSAGCGVSVELVARLPGNSNPALSPREIPSRLGWRLPGPLTAKA